MLLVIKRSKKVTPGVVTKPISLYHETWWRRRAKTQFICIPGPCTHGCKHTMYPPAPQPYSSSAVNNNNRNFLVNGGSGGSASQSHIQTRSTKQCVVQTQLPLPPPPLASLADSTTLTMENNTMQQTINVFGAHANATSSDHSYRSQSYLSSHRTVSSHKALSSQGNRLEVVYTTHRIDATELEPAENNQDHAEMTAEGPTTQGFPSNHWTDL